MDRDPRTTTFLLKQLVNANGLKHSTKLTGQIVTYLVFIYFVLSICVTCLISIFAEEMIEGEIWISLILTLLFFLLGLTLFFIYCQPNSGTKLPFSVPFVPFLPAISILVNIYLMMMLDVMTWIRFAVWMVIGLVIYFSYGVWNSKCRDKLSVIKVEASCQN